MRCAHAHIYNLYCAQGILQGSSLKTESVSGGSFIRGESVREEFKLIEQVLIQKSLFAESFCFEPPSDSEGTIIMCVLERKAAIFWFMLAFMLSRVQCCFNI